MIEAERILLKHALEDSKNELFVFPSDRWELVTIMATLFYTVHESFRLDYILSRCIWDASLFIGMKGFCLVEAYYICSSYVTTSQLHVLFLAAYQLGEH